MAPPDGEGESGGYLLPLGCYSRDLAPHRPPGLVGLFLPGEGSMADVLSAAVVIDYQNVHLTAANLFAPGQAYHEALLHPLHYANQLITARNARMSAEYPRAVLGHVFVYRGLPSSAHDPDAYARNLAQKAEWERDSRVLVTHRPLKYRYEYDGQGKKVSDAAGNLVILGKQEKGVDVLCALALVREARLRDLVILASQDSDLEPALDDALRIDRAKVETSSWFDPKTRSSREIRPHTGRKIWNTRLQKSNFTAALDLNTY